MDGSPVQLLGREGAQQAGLVVPVDADALDGGIGVGVVAGESGRGLAGADDQLIGNGVELGAATVERDGGVLPEDAAVRVVISVVAAVRSTTLEVL